MTDIKKDLHEASKNKPISSINKSESHVNSYNKEETDEYEAHMADIIEGSWEEI